MCSSKCGNCTCHSNKSADIQILVHHIYEYKKGIRNLVLHTMNRVNLDYAETQLKRQNILYCTQMVSEQKVNVFFGKRECVDIVKTFADVSLSQISDEQDFMLGIMLGYDRVQQYERYINRYSKRRDVQRDSNRFSIII